MAATNTTRKAFTIDDSEVRQFLGRLPERVLIPASVRALNKVADNVRVGASRAIREKRALSAKTVRESMQIRKATRTDLKSTLVVTGRPIPLREYKARPTRAGVTVEVTPGDRKLIEHQGNKAFIVEGLGKHVFAREGGSRLPIKKLFGPSLPATFVSEQVERQWVEIAKDSMIKRMSDEVRFELIRQSRPKRA
jgi:hypothetical protein